MLLYLQKKNKFIKKNFLYLVLIVTAFLYLPSLNAYFEQDEWSAFGRYFGNIQTSWGLIKEPFTPYITHYTPLSHLLFNLQTFLFGINYTPFILTSIVSHLFVVFVAYLFFKAIFKNTTSSLISTALFAFSASGHQATTWIAASTATHWSSFFGILALYFAITKPKFYIILSFLFISLLFKEITIALFLLIPITLYAFPNNKFNKLKTSLSIIVSAIMYVLLRIYIVLFSHVQTKGDNLVTNIYSTKSILENLLILPFKTLMETVIPVVQLNNRGEVGVLVLILFFVLLSFLNTNIKYKKIILYGLSFVFLNSLVYAIAPQENSSLIDSRNLYFPSIGTAIILSTLVTIYIKKHKKIGFMFLSIFLFSNIFILEKEINSLVIKGKERKEILSEIKNQVPSLPDKAIFYTESNTTFYGQSENTRILPFQSGFGQTLLVNYSTNKKYPKDFYNVQDRFLWKIDEQGYKEANGIGFGYFRNFQMLTEALKSNNLSEDSVFAFSYNSIGKIKNTTDLTRNRLRSFYSKTTPISRQQIIFTPSVNPQDFYKALDRKRETYWDSKVQYKFYQYLDIELLNPLNISRIQVDVYKNKDQDKIGYRLLESDDQNNWNEIFYSIQMKPDENGLVDLYFSPTNKKYLRLEEIGKHQYATWVISEIQLFEKNE